MTLTETMVYCGVCGHPKEAHDLNVHVDPAKAVKEGEAGRGACHDTTNGQKRVCFEYENWVEHSLGDRRKHD